MSTTDRAICIRATDYSETSQVLTLLTRAGGVVRLIAKGSRRPRSKSGGTIDLLSEGECVFTTGKGESMGLLMEFAETISRSSIREGLDRLGAAMYMAELCGAVLAEGDPHPKVFDLLHNALGRMGQADASPALVLAYFQWRLIRHIGLLGELNLCVSCGGKVGTKDVYFSSSLGGLLCRDCEPSATEKYHVSGAALSALAALAAAEAGKKPRLPTKQADAANALLAYHIQYQLGKRLKTARGAIRS
ncbi:MAG: DNA repair protein RecO [Planctomycetota bacterium]|nr:DNA repair protein RecO [Planctomycetota bacterium]